MVTTQTKARRHFLRAADGLPMRCPSCDVEMWSHTPPPPERASTLLTVDHILPRERGGATEPHNLRPMCAWCNGLRGALDHCTGALACVIAIKGRATPAKTVHRWWLRSRTARR